VSKKKIMKYMYEVSLMEENVGFNIRVDENEIQASFK
jgi:hypothetical protein